MINRFFFLFSALVFLIGNTSSGVASLSLLTHTQHTPIELKPTSLDNSYQIASVCFLGSKDCGNDGKFNSGDDYEVDSAQQCKNEGYLITSCTAPEIPYGQCPYNNKYFKECKDINGEKCRSEGYAQNCPDGSILNESQVCPYDSSYKKCECNPCEGYNYTYEEATSEGYVVGTGCNSCGTMKYQRQNALCDGYLSCECGGEIGASSCKSGEVTKFNVCKSCCATSFIYNTTNCDQTKNIFCGDSCGGRYKKCRPRPFIGSTTTIDGITFATEEALCPGLKKFSGGGGFGYTDILTGKDYWVEACASTTQACLILSQDIETKSVVSLSDDVNCGSMTLSTGCNNLTIKGNGHTLYMNDGIGTYIRRNCGNAGTFRLENLTLDIQGYWAPYIIGGSGGCMDKILYTSSLSGVEISDVVVKSNIPFGFDTVKVYGKSFFEGRGSDARVDYGLSVYGTLNMKNIYVMDHAYPLIYGMLNYKGEQLDNIILRGGTVNACVDKVVLSQCTSEASGTVNYSGAIDLSKCDDKSRITFNHVPNLCSSSIFSGAFWN